MSQPFAPFYPPVSVPVGIGPPNVLYVPINELILPTWVTPFDFTTVTTVTLHVTRESDGSFAAWATSAFVDVTTSGLVAIYAFQPTDVTVDGRYLVRPYLSVSGFSNAIPCSSTVLLVTQQ